MNIDRFDCNKITKGKMVCSFIKFSQLLVEGNVHYMEISLENLYVDIKA